MSLDPSHLVVDCYLQSQGLQARGRMDTAPLPSMLHLGTRAADSLASSRSAGRASPYLKGPFVTGNPLTRLDYQVAVR